jgi:hypothetical protein
MRAPDQCVDGKITTLVIAVYNRNLENVQAHVRLTALTRKNLEQNATKTAAVALAVAREIKWETGRGQGRGGHRARVTRRMGMWLYLCAH